MTENETALTAKNQATEEQKEGSPTWICSSARANKIERQSKNIRFFNFKSLWDICKKTGFHTQAPVGVRLFQDYSIPYKGKKFLEKLGDL